MPSNIIRNKDESYKLQAKGQDRYAKWNDLNYTRKLFSPIRNWRSILEIKWRYDRYTYDFETYCKTKAKFSWLQTKTLEIAISHIDLHLISLKTRPPTIQKGKKNHSSNIGFYILHHYTSHRNTLYSILTPQLMRAIFSLCTDYLYVWSTLKVRSENIKRIRKSIHFDMGYAEV